MEYIFIEKYSWTMHEWHFSYHRVRQLEMTSLIHVKGLRQRGIINSCQIIFICIDFVHKNILNKINVFYNCDTVATMTTIHPHLSFTMTLQWRHLKVTQLHYWIFLGEYTGHQRFPHKASIMRKACRVREPSWHLCRHHHRNQIISHHMRCWTCATISSNFRVC